MSRIRIRTSARLHFGLLARGPAAPRQFGGLGLMVDRPGMVIEAEPAEFWSASGPLADRAEMVARRVAAGLCQQGLSPHPLAFRIEDAPAEHLGLGAGTQLSLAIARLVAKSAGIENLDAPSLARLSGRGLRSGVGLHGFALGGLIVEGGHRNEGGTAPLLARMAFPEEWSVLVLIPSRESGLHGSAEIRAFADLPPIPEAETDRLCRLVLLGVMAAVAERDLNGFGASLEELQHRVGRWFAPAQGGVFAGPRLEASARWLNDQGLLGVGQSSWGPTLYGFAEEPPEWRDGLSRRFSERFGAETSALWTRASDSGAILDQHEGTFPSSSLGSTGTPL